MGTQIVKKGFFMSEDPNTPVFNAIPPVIIALFLILAGIELTFFLAETRIIGGAGGFAWRADAIERFGMNTNILPWMLEQGRFPVEYLLRFVSYAFIHAGFLQTAIACTLFLAMGRYVGMSFHPVSVVAIFVCASVVGAVAYSYFGPSGAWLIGAYPAIYGLIGAYSFILWIALSARNEPQYQAFYLIAFLMGVQLLFELLFSGSSAWVADFSGFLTGFILSFVLSPGGAARVLRHLRRR